MAVMLAGAAYFAAVFLVAFALGVVRTFVLEPRVGEMWAVACETLFLIGAMYLATKYIVARVYRDRTGLGLIAVGFIGLLLQQLAEFALIFAAGETFAMHVAYLATPAGMIYLAALGVFAILPWLLLRPER